MNRWIYWRNIGLCSSCRSLYRLLNYIGWKPEGLSPVLYVNLSVAKTSPFTFKTSERWGHANHVLLHCLQSICRQKPTTPTQNCWNSFCMWKGTQTVAALISFFRGLASGELKVNKLHARLPMNAFNLKEKTMMNWWSCATIEMIRVGISRHPIL